MKPNFNQILGKVKNGATKHAPEIFIGVGLASMASAIVLAVKATPKAIKLIEEEKAEKEVEELTKVETIKCAWKPYVPAAVSAGLGVACILASNNVSRKRTTALTAAYAISERTLADYKEKVLETIGEKKEKEVRDKVAKKHLGDKPVTQSNVIITKKGETLCFDALSGRYFNSDIDLIKRAVNNVNKDLLDDMYVSLNEFYDELDLDHTSLGDQIGWNVDKGLIDVYLSSQIADDGRPAIVIDFDKAPTYGFNKIVR